MGPRSYSIIEQGMISRLIEAKPEEVRVFLEEAAGISKYKERRRETSNRIKHTKENLDRLMDVLDEVEKQIKHLDRQAKTAERYGRYKDDERRTDQRRVVGASKTRDLDDNANMARSGARRNARPNWKLPLRSQRKQEASPGRGATCRQSRMHTDAFNVVQGRLLQSRLGDCAPGTVN